MKTPQKSLFRKLLERPERVRRRKGLPARYLYRSEVTYASDGLWANKNLDGFIDDEKFVQAYGLGVNSGQRVGVTDVNDIKWRVHVICWAAKHASRLEGDYVECGVNTGILSLAAMHWIDFGEMPDRKWWLLDTYRGLDEAQQLTKEDLTAARKANEKYYTECYELAKKNFSNYPNAILVRGTVPDTLAQVTSDKIAYLSIDMNYHVPEIAAGSFFWDKLVTGGIIILDDYAFPGYEKQNDAWNAFAKERDGSYAADRTGHDFEIVTNLRVA